MGDQKFDDVWDIFGDVAETNLNAAPLETESNVEKSILTEPISTDVNKLSMPTVKESNIQAELVTVDVEDSKKDSDNSSQEGSNNVSDDEESYEEYSASGDELFDLSTGNALISEPIKDNPNKLRGIFKEKPTTDFAEVPEGQRLHQLMHGQKATFLSPVTDSVSDIWCLGYIRRYVGAFVTAWHFHKQSGEFMMYVFIMNIYFFSYTILYLTNFLTKKKYFFTNTWLLV